VLPGNLTVEVFGGFDTVCAAGLVLDLVTFLVVFAFFAILFFVLFSL